MTGAQWEPGAISAPLTLSRKPFHSREFLDPEKWIDNLSAFELIVFVQRTSLFRISFKFSSCFWLGYFTLLSEVLCYLEEVLKSSRLEVDRTRRSTRLYWQEFPNMRKLLVFWKSNSRIVWIYWNCSSTLIDRLLFAAITCILKGKATAHSRWHFGIFTRLFPGWTQLLFALSCWLIFLIPRRIVL